MMRKNTLKEYGLIPAGKPETGMREYMKKLWVSSRIWVHHDVRCSLLPISEEQFSVGEVERNAAAEPTVVVER